MKIISGILIIFVAFMSFKHGWDGLRNSSPNGNETLLSWGIRKPLQTIISVITILSALMILFPQTFFVGNIIAATLFILLMCFQLNTGNIKAVLMEIPFLLITLTMIYLGHPLKK
jgi:hypothetical protein